MPDACASGCQSAFGFCLPSNFSQTSLHHSTHVLTELPPARRAEEATSTHLATIGGPGHLTLVHHAGTTTTLSGSQVMTIETISVSSHLSFVSHAKSITTPPVSQSMTIQTIGGLSHLTFVPHANSSTTLSPVHYKTHHNTNRRPSITETDPRRRAEPTHSVAMPNPLDPLCINVCRPYFKECVKVSLLHCNNVL